MKTSAIVGTDIVRVSQISESITLFGDKFINRIYTQNEIDYCSGRKQHAAYQSYAARFAAKEAVIKVLRPKQWINMKCIEVVKLSDGSVEVKLHGQAAIYAKNQGVISFSLSISHEFEYATAVVLAEIQSPKELEEYDKRKKM